MAESSACRYYADDAPCCITYLLNGQEMFLSIGTPKEEMESDPCFKKFVQDKEVRFFDPALPQTFEPKNAAAVVRYYAMSPHKEIRKNRHPWVQEVYQYFIDRCNLTLRIESYNTISEKQRKAFEKEIESIQFIRKWHLE